MSKKKILVFGNPDVRKDSLPVKIIPDLRKAFPEIEFIHMDGMDEMHNHGKKLFILDSAQGIDKCMVMDDPELITGKILSAHEFDLANNLKLLKKIKAIENVTIFCVPMKISKSDAIAQLKRLIKKEMK